MKTSEIVVASLPKGPLSPDNFARREAELPALQDGEVLARTLLVSVDAANRAWMNGTSYRAAVQAGDVFPGHGVAEVLDSRSPALKPGDLVAGETGWRTFAVMPGAKLRPLPNLRPASRFLSVLGVAGRTAYHGLVDVGRPQPGETVLISAAAGSVGSLVGQIVKLLGCRAVGIAGGAAKCERVVADLGFDACIDYKAEPSLAKAVRRECPDGVSIYFDNVGGEVLGAALSNMVVHGRIVCCGSVSGYDDPASAASPRGIPGLLVVRRVRMEGFLVSDFYDGTDTAERQLAAWAAEGGLKVVEDIREGLDALPGALIGLLAGDNFGKRMVRLAPDPVLFAGQQRGGSPSPDRGLWSPPACTLWR